MFQKSQQTYMYRITNINKIELLITNKPNFLVLFLRQVSHFHLITAKWELPYLV